MDRPFAERKRQENISVLPWTLTASFSTCVLSKASLGGNKVDPALQDNDDIQFYWTTKNYHVVFSHDLHFIDQSGLIAGGKDEREGRKTVFFTAVCPMNQPQTQEP